jgi:Icc-related predicted phosphoesterase
MIRLVYGTDFHGIIRHYEDIFNYAVKNNIHIIHLGADLLPKGSNLDDLQKKFVNGYLKEFHEKCKNINIDVLSYFGNDDLYTRKKYFRKYASLLDETPYSKEGYEFKAYGYVLDYPFGLKTACKLDYRGWKLNETYTGTPCDYNDSGRYEIKDLENYFDKKGTIEEDLKTIYADQKTIMAIHQPPPSLGMDVCVSVTKFPRTFSFREVGSGSVFDFIMEKQPLLVLCGHIHESILASGSWKETLNRTTVIQPGQILGNTTFVDIEIENDVIKAFLIST